MPKKPSAHKSIFSLIKDIDADGHQKQRAFRFLRLDLGKLKSASEFQQACGDFGALCGLLAPFASDTVIISACNSNY